MDRESATGLLEWISKLFGKSSAGVILYEPIGGHDAFGKVMVRNLAVCFRLEMVNSVGKGHKLKNTFCLSNLARPILSP